MSPQEIDTLFNKQSGLLGLSGYADMRAVLDGIASGDELCSLALDVYVRRIRKYMGAYWFALGGHVDAVVFSAGIGENSAEVRRRVCEGMGWVGLEIDEKRNKVAVEEDKLAEIQSKGSTVKVLVIPTDEELSIAEQTLQVVRAPLGQ